MCISMVISDVYQASLAKLMLTRRQAIQQLGTSYWIGTKSFQVHHAAHAMKTATGHICALSQFILFSAQRPKFSLVLHGV